MLEYGTLARRCVRDFDAKWLRGGAPADEPLVGSGDIQFVPLALTRMPREQLLKTLLGFLFQAWYSVTLLKRMGLREQVGSWGIAQQFSDGRAVQWRASPGLPPLEPARG